MILTGSGAAALLAALHAECFPEGERWDEAAMAELLTMPGSFATVSPSGFAPSGFALARVAADEAELLTIAVLPAHRRRNVAAGLLHALSAEAIRRGATRLFLEVATDNAGALALYARAGFAVVGVRRRYYPDGGDALIMAASIGAAAEPSVPPTDA